MWRLLERAVETGDLKREGTGLKNDPFRYWLPSLDKRWRTDLATWMEKTFPDIASEVPPNPTPTPSSERDDLE